MGKNFLKRVVARLRRDVILLDTFLGAAFIFFLVLIFHSVRFLGESTLFDPIGDAISDVEFTDIVFSRLRSDPPLDTNVVLVNIGNLDREGIARQIEILNRYQPGVLAIDGFFWDLKTSDPQGDRRLAAALAKVPCLVMAAKLLYDPAVGRYDSLACSHPLFNTGDFGFANLETEALAQHQYKVCRTFPPVYTMRGQRYKSFAVKVAEAAGPASAGKFLQRDNARETINYRGNIIDFGQSGFGGRYRALDVNDVLERRFNPAAIRGKVLIMGYLGDDFTDPSWEDKFFTPLNNKYAGRSNPDMFGAVIHANIVSMIMNEEPINRQSEASAYWWAVLLGFANVWLFTAIYHRMPRWYDGLTKSIQVAEVLLVLAFNVAAFHWFGYKTNLTLATVVILLASDSLEVCYGVLKNLYKAGGRRQLFSIHRELKRLSI